MPIYMCRHGDVKEVALSEPDVFVVQDTQGRDWFCREGTEDEMNGGFPFDMMLAQQRAHQQGASEVGTEVRMIRTELAKLGVELGR